MVKLDRISKHLLIWLNLATKELFIIILATTANTSFAGDTSANEGTNLTSTEIIQTFKGQVSSTTYLVASYYLAFVTVLGTSFNVVVIFIILTDNKLHTPINAILLNQAFADFGIAFFGNPVAFFNAVNEDWMLGETYCYFYGFMMSLFGICSIFTLSVLAYQRYKMICHALHMTSHLSWSQSLMYVGVIWLCSFISSIPPVFGWGSYKQEAANISCSVDWHSRNMNSMSYIAFLFIFALFLPLFVIGFSYYNIIRTVKRIRKETMGAIRKAESRVAFMVFLMVCAFTLAWGPYAIFSLLIAFTNYTFNPTLSITPALFAKSSVCYNPIIYFYMNNDFRKSWLKRLGRGQQDDVSNDIRHIQLSKVRSTDARAQNDEQPMKRNGQRFTVISDLSTPVTKENSDFPSLKRDGKLSELIPYYTLPFFRRKLSLKTSSLPNII